MSNPVIIGNAELWLGDCRDILPNLPKVDAVRVESGRSALNPHVTGLTEAHEVVQGVCFGGHREQSKRADMVDRNRLANVLLALLTCASVSRNRAGASLNPAFPTICGYPANVVGRVMAGLVSCLERAMAGFATEAPATDGFVLPSLPRLDLERGAALSAIMALASHDVHGPRLLRGEGIGRTQPFTPLVPHLVPVRHQPVSYVPLATARLTAKPRGPGPVWLNVKGGGADFACFRDHARIIPQFMGGRTTDIACRRIEAVHNQGRLIA